MTTPEDIVKEPEGPAGEPGDEPLAAPRERPRLSNDALEIGGLIGRDVVLDTPGEVVYIGLLEVIGEHFFELSNAVVHDTLHGRTSKEIYILEALKYGVKKNRKRVFVKRSSILSLSALAEVVEY